MISQIYINESSKIITENTFLKGFIIIANLMLQIFFTRM